MADQTPIEWTDATWNIITGCTLVDEGCRNCYAARLAATRLKNHPSRARLARLNAAGSAKFTGEVRFNEQWLTQPLKWTKPRRIFVCAHGDLFHEAVPDEWIDRVFAVMALAPQHTFQILSKRPERMREYISAFRTGEIGQWAYAIIPDRANATKYLHAFGSDEDPDIRISVWPLPNVWLGTSVSDQASADARIPALAETPAAVRFISAEPLLGSLDVNPYLDRLNWVIAGGESGPGARPAHPDWFRILRDQCVNAGVAFHFKQWGVWEADEIGPEDARSTRFPPGHVEFRKVGKSIAGRKLEGREWNEFPKVHP